MEICKQLNIKCVEKNIETYDVYTADEAFMTGSPFCLIPVTQLNSAAIGKGKLGPVTDKLIKKWGKNVGVDIIKQIKEYGKECATILGDSPTPYQFSKDKK
jgi:branched-chain amino acid aminotransferase